HRFPDESRGPCPPRRAWKTTIRLRTFRSVGVLLLSSRVPVEDVWRLFAILLSVGPKVSFGPRTYPRRLRKRVRGFSDSSPFRPFPHFRAGSRRHEAFPQVYLRIMHNVIFGMKTSRILRWGHT